MNVALRNAPLHEGENTGASEAVVVSVTLMGDGSQYSLSDRVRMGRQPMHSSKF